MYKSEMNCILFIVERGVYQFSPMHMIKYVEGYSPKPSSVDLRVVMVMIISSL